MKGFSVLATGLVALFHCNLVVASEITTSVETRYSDNITKSDTAPVDDFENSVNLYVSTDDRYGKFDNSLLADMSYKFYTHDTFSNDLETELDWNGVYHALPNRFLWEISDQLREVVVDTAEVNTPDNRERRNIFSTGPRFIYPITKVDSLNISALAQRTDFQTTTGLDSDRLRTESSWNHLFSERSSGGINYRWSKTEFSRGRNIYNTETTVFALISNQQNILSLEYGLVDVLTKGTNERQEGDTTVWDASYKRQIDLTSDFTIRYVRNVGDSSNGFDALIDGQYINLTELDVVQVTEWSADYSKTFSDKSRLNIQFYDDEVEYVSSRNVEERTGIDIRLSKSLTPTVSVYFDGGYENALFRDILREDDRYNISLGLSKSLYKNLSLKLDTGVEEQQSNITNSDYTEWSITAAITYIPAF